MENAPLISVIVPCYNQAQYLDECLQSVQDQTYQNWECIIVNDGSPDNTEEVAKAWTEKDSRFIYLYKENGGLSSARNAGIEMAKGEWILPLDADDKIENRYLELAENEFDKGYTIIYCEAEKFGAVNEKWNIPNFSHHLMAQRNLIFCTAFFRKESWKHVKGYDEKIRLGWEDWDFWISILKMDKTVKRIREICFFYRVKEESMVSNLFSKKKAEDQSALLNYIYSKHIDYFVQHIGSFRAIGPKLKQLESLNQYNKKLHSNFWFRALKKLGCIEKYRENE